MKTERLALHVSEAFLEGLDELAEAEDLNRAEVGSPEKAGVTVANAKAANQAAC